MAENGGLVVRIARRVAGVALAIDIFATLARVVEVGMKFTLPDVSRIWEAHANPILAAAYNATQILVLAAIALGVTASLFLSIPLDWELSRRMDNAHLIGDPRKRRQQLDYLDHKLKRIRWLIGMAITPFILLSFSYFTKWDIAALITDIAAPVIILYVIANTEREHDQVDTQAEAMHATKSVALQAVLNTANTAGKETLTKSQGRMLKEGAQGTIEGIIDAMIPRDESERMYTIAQLCEKMGVPAYVIGADGKTKQSADYKRIQRIVAKALKDGELDIVKDEKTRGYLCPGKLRDRLFGDYVPSRTQQGQAEDTDRKILVFPGAQGAESAGQA